MALPALPALTPSGGYAQIVAQYFGQVKALPLQGGETTALVTNYGSSPAVVRFDTAVASTTASGASGASALTLASSASVLVGQLLLGTGIQPGTVINAIDNGLKTVAVGASGGTGYLVGDILAVVHTGASGGTVRVLTVDGSGAVVTVAIVTAGDGYAAATDQATTGGTGAGAQITVSAVNAVISISQPTTAVLSSGAVKVFSPIDNAKGIGIGINKALPIGIGSNTHIVYISQSGGYAGGASTQAILNLTMGS